jgi:hypothetical protein
MEEMRVSVKGKLLRLRYKKTEKGIFVDADEAQLVFSQAFPEVKSLSLDSAINGRYRDTKKALPMEQSPANRLLWFLSYFSCGVFPSILYGNRRWMQ